MREKQVENQIKEYVTGLYRADSFVTKIHAGAEQGRDTLDLIGAYMGKPFQYEVKKPGKAASDMQNYLIRRARKGGYIADCGDSLEHFIMMFSERGNK
jgi:hypothetical protein